MSMFTLVISCMTTSNLPWFMELTFQVPMQYCSLQHRILLLSPVTSAAGYCFCFGSIPSFFLELFLHWSPVAYWEPNDLGSSSFGILSFCLFILYMGFSRQEYWSGLPFPSPVDHILSGLSKIHWIMEKAREFQKNISFCFIDYAKALDCVDHNKLWKILKEMGIPDHLTCLLRNLYAGQEATVRTGHGTTHWFQIGKGVRQGCILSPCLFNLYAEYIMRNAGLEKHKLESRLPGEISITSDMQMTPPLWQKVKRN